MVEMLSWHKVGQEVVVCRDGMHLVSPDVDLPRFPKGTQLRLARVRYDVRARVPGVYLGFACIDGEYHHAWFQPVKHTSIDCFLSLLTPSPDTVRKLEEVG